MVLSDDMGVCEGAFWGYAGEDAEEVRLEGAYGSFGYVAAMNIWRY